MALHDSIAVQDGPAGSLFERLVALSSEAMLACSFEGKILHCNPAFAAVLGWTSAETRGRPVSELLHRDDMSTVLERWRGSASTGEIVTMDCRWMHRDGGWVWLSWSGRIDADLGMMIGVGRNISRRKAAEVIDRGQRTVLDAIAHGQPLPAILRGVVEFVERESPGALCSVLTLDETGTHMHVAAAPSVPDVFNAAIEGLAIGEAVGSCGTAIWRRSRVVVTDIAQDPLWAAYRDLALVHDLRACWAEPFFGPDGHVLGALALYARDVRGPAPDELALLEAAARLAGIAVSSRQAAEDLELAQRAMAHMSDMVLISRHDVSMDGPGRLVFANAAFERTVGYSRAEMQALGPRRLASLVTDEGEADVRRRRVREGAAVHSPIALRTRDGRTLPAELEMAPIRDSAGRVTHTLTVVRDLSRSVEAEVELRRTQSIFRAILDAAPLVVWSMDRQGVFTRVEGRGLESTGIAPGQLVGSSAVEFFRDVRLSGDDGRFHTADEVTKAVLERGERLVGTVHIRGHYFEVAVGPLRNADGVIEGEVCVALVVSDRVRLETQLRHAQKMEAVGRLAGGVAHDFNNVLTAILGFATVTLEDVPADGAVADGLMEIIAATRRAGDLTKRLLVFSRQQVLQPRSLLLSEIVSTCEKLLVRLIGEDVQLATSHAEPVWQVRGDPSQLEQVVMNLAVNARDAMPYGGTLLISTRSLSVSAATPAPDPSVPAGQWVLLSVSDNGVGMAEDVLSRIYEPFFTTKAPGRGSGLGLSTVYGIVTQSGGHVHVESTLGAGTTFRVYLPREESDVVRVETPAKPERPGAGTETVLIAEDDRGVRDLIRLALSRFGYKCLVAASGEEALGIAAAHDGPLPILVSDVVMPRMSGPQLRDRLLAIRPETRVLFLSGYTDDEMIKRGVLEDGVAFLQKPFPPDALARKVREVLDKP